MNGGILKAAGYGATAALAGFLLSTTSARAADLGGNCCADLEERVAELEATTARKGNRRVSLTVSGQVNTAIMAWDQGVQDAIFIVDNGVSRSGFNFDGTAKINPNLTAGFQLVLGLATGARSHDVSQWDDDGNQVYTSQTTGLPSYNAALRAGGGETVDGDVAIGIELANWFIRHDQLGEIRLGRINTAQAGTTGVDLGGVGVIANANFGLWQRSFFLNDPVSPSVFTPGLAAGQTAVNCGATTCFAVNQARWTNLFGGTSIDVSGLSRQEGISYTTPTLAGFSLQATYNENDIWDAALRYAGEFSGFRLAAAASYSVNQDPEGSTAGGESVFNQKPTSDPDIRKWQGSASVLHVASGLFLSGAYIRQSYEGNTPAELILGAGGVLPSAVNRPDTKAWYLLGGISKNWFGMGNTALYGEYGRVDDGATGTASSAFGLYGATGLGGPVLDSEASFWGLGVVQNIDAAAMELYLSYRQYSGSIVGSACQTENGAGTSCVALETAETKKFEDFGVVMAGARIRF